MLIPFGETTAENGATEFILGSHKKTVPECAAADGAAHPDRVVRLLLRTRAA